MFQKYRLDILLFWYKNNICEKILLTTSWKSRGLAYSQIKIRNMSTEVHPQHLFANKDYAVLILNTNIQFKHEVFKNFWNNAVIRHVVDGGTNRFFDFIDRMPEASRESVKIPDLASGDFDSITDASMDRLKKSSCKIVPTPDQDNTDFTKALAVLCSHLKESNSKVKKVVVICECVGRIDHIMGNLNTLHKNVFVEDVQSEIGVYLLSSDTLCWLLPADQKIKINFVDEVPNLTCSILPLVGPTEYVSKGLQWDLSRDMTCNFGGLVSTSNKVICKNVEITSFGKHSVFTVEIHENKHILSV